MPKGHYERTPEILAGLRRGYAARSLPIPESEVRELAGQGLTTAEIAEHFGCQAEAIRRRMIRWGIPRLPGKARQEKNYFWNGGRTVDKNGYVLLKANDHPHANSGGYVREHRLVVEAHLGRFLDPQEVVHHLNGDRGDNRIENLEVFGTNGEHLKVELTGKVPNWTPEGRRRILEGVRRGNRKRRANPRASGTDGPSSP